jgi:hypothetical protein
MRRAYSRPMERHRDGEIEDLVRNTIIWMVVVIWLVWGYIVQDPPGDAYTDTVRGAFTVVLAILIPLVSVTLISAWVSEVRQRSG